MLGYELLLSYIDSKTLINITWYIPAFREYKIFAFVYSFSLQGA